jgi:hypothetical protein
MSFESDYKWQQKLLPQVIQHCGTHLAHRVIGEAPQEEDKHRNTDLMVLNWDQVRIGVRLRTNSYYHNPVYRNQFTIRASRDMGSTEYAKLINGFGDYFFYGFTNTRKTHILAWFIGDLNVFRQYRGDYLALHDVEPGTVKPNSDGSSQFRAFNIADLPKSFIVHRDCSWLRIQQDRGEAV